MNETIQHDEPQPLSGVEKLKTESHGLYGAIPEELGQDTDHFSEDAVHILKHHGTYQQDNRDTRTERKKAGLGWEYSMMIRTKFPGGRITAQQYLLCDELADKYGQGHMRITSRQCLQFHGVLKKNLRPLIHDLNLLGEMTTLGGCGDVVRNTMSSPVADIDPRFNECETDLIALAQQISNRFLPNTQSYFDLWLDGEKVTVNEDGTVSWPEVLRHELVEDPVYGFTYLPRKFKIGLGADFDNSSDLLTQDIGIMAITDSGRILGYEILVGGGLGHTHKKPKTFARLGDSLAFVQENEVLDIVEAIIKVQRDAGDRSDRRHARLKYLVDEWGLDKFREEVFRYAGRTFPAPRNVKPYGQPHYLGWSKQRQPGLNYVGIWVENGRVTDFPDSFQFKTGLRDIIERYKPSVRFTPHHNVILANIRDEDVAGVQALLDKYHIPTDRGISTLRRMEMACPALPTCPQSQTDAERVLPLVIKAIEEAGHGDAEVSLRMSGCPNNCPRPLTAEIGLEGKGKERYVLCVGGDYNGNRLAQPLVENIALDRVAPTVTALLQLWKDGREEGERFGDWCIRVGLEFLKTKIEAVAEKQ